VSLTALVEPAAEVLVGPARPFDVPELVRLERLAWPSGDGMQADGGTFARRIQLGGVLAARHGGRIVGCLSTFRPRWARAEALDEVLTRCPEDLLGLPSRPRWEEARRRFGLPASWHDATGDGALDGGRMHGPEGDVVFGIGIATDPRERGRSVARALLEAALDQAARTGARYFLAYSRLPQYHRSPTVGLDDYLAQPATRGGQVGPYDFGLRLHWRVGARPARTPSGRAGYLGIPTAMRDDFESRGCGALVVTPLADRTPYPFESLRDAVRR
jgi:GNAT superfamily N-acetyltransferase